MLFGLSGCPRAPEAPAVTEPFLGGTQGLSMAFSQGTPPAEVLDQGQFPFDIILRVKNEGETLVTKDQVKVSISGFEPGQFGVSPAALSKNSPEDLQPVSQDAQGRRRESPEVLIEFPGLSYLGEITGAGFPFPIQADVCYTYGTKAVSFLCSRANLLNPERNGICEINEDKTIFSSGAPVHITSLTENVRSANKIAFSFEIREVGRGDVFGEASRCDKATTANQDVVSVEVITQLPGLTCTGLGGGATNAGTVKLINGARQITCTQELATPSDFQFAVNINLGYDYEETISTEIFVKHVIG